MPPSSGRRSPIVASLVKGSAIRRILCNGGDGVPAVCGALPRTCSHCKEAALHFARQPAVLPGAVDRGPSGGVFGRGGRARMKPVRGMRDDMTYEEVLSCLFSERDEGYRDFHKKLLKNDKIEVIGVRMPVLRRLARAWKGELAGFLSFPDEYYEVTVLKFSLYALLPFAPFCEGLPQMVGLFDNWATVDGFMPPASQRTGMPFSRISAPFRTTGGKFVERYALVRFFTTMWRRSTCPRSSRRSRRRTGAATTRAWCGVAPCGGARKMLRCGAGLSQGGAAAALRP